MAASNLSPTPPFLRWAGSKRQQASLLASYWHASYQRYVEPFLGSGVLFFLVAPPAALLGDINPDLINTFRQIKADPAAVARSLTRLRTGPEAYYRIRSERPNKRSRIQRASRFIYLNRYCFNGIYRTNRSGLFNVPYGGGRTGALPSLALLKACSRSLAPASLKVADFEVLLDQVQHGDFVYMDPPYSIAQTRTFSEYNPAGFGPHDVKRLRAAMIRLDRQGIPFLLSYAHSDESQALARGFYSQEVTTRRNIAGFAANRRTAREVLITNTSA